MGPLNQDPNQNQTPQPNPSPETPAPQNQPANSPEPILGQPSSFPRQGQYGSQPVAADNSKKIGIIIAIAAALLLIGGGIAAAMMMKGAGDDSQSNTQAPTTATSEFAEEGEEPAETPKAAEVAINRSFQDDLNYVTTVTRIFRNFPVTEEYARKSLERDNKELVLVEYKIENKGSRVNGGNPTPLRLELRTSDGKDSLHSYDVDKEELKAAGYTPLDSETPKVGEPKTGVVLYEIPKGDNKLSVYYHLKVNIIGGDDVDKEYTLNLF